MSDTQKWVYSQFFKYVYEWLQIFLRAKLSFLISWIHPYNLRKHASPQSTLALRITHLSAHLRPWLCNQTLKSLDEYIL